MAEPILLQAERSYYKPTETWMIEIENETGEETLDELKAIFDTDQLVVCEVETLS